MKVLVIGGTGTVGSQVVQELLKQNAETYVLTRTEANAKKLPGGVKAVIGDLLIPNDVKKIFNNIDSVFLLNPVGNTEASEGLFAVNGARMAGVKRIVYMSVHKLDDWIHLPHFGSKLPIELAIKDSGIPYTVLRPNNFYQNDYWFKDALLQYGVYPQPLGDVGVSRVDVADIAETAAITLTQDGHEGKTYNLVGPDALTGAQVAAIWSETLGTTITYAGNDLDSWEQQFLQFLPDWMVFDFKLMYECFQRDGFLATQEDIDIQTKLLGHAPRKFSNFTKATAKIWKAAQ